MGNQCTVFRQEFGESIVHEKPSKQKEPFPKITVTFVNTNGDEVETVHFETLIDLPARALYQLISPDFIKRHPE